MKLSVLSFSLLGLSLSSHTFAVKSYEGYRTYRISGGGDVANVRAKLGTIDLDVWEDKLASSGLVDVMVGPEQLAAFEELGLGAQILHENLGAAIDQESSVPEETLRKRQSNGSNYALDYFETYHSYATHISFLSSLAREFSNNSRIFSAGTSYEGNPIQGIHIWGDGGGPFSTEVRPGIVFHSTVHAREWITTMVDEYIAYTMLNEYGSNENITRYLNTADLYIIPLVNPDGFIFTQTQDRLWRKNRQPTPDDRGGCVGTDENRNWPFEWDAAEGAGSSTDPCSQTYRGPTAGSTPEVQGLAAQLGQVRDSGGLLLYIDWHSYSQLFMYPFGFSCDEVVANADGYAMVANGTVEAIADVYGTQFEAGPICQTIYQVAGGSVDWAYGTADATWSFTFELRDTGTFGFVLPPSQILPSCVEAFAGVEYLLGSII